jgi:hypothetical protein
MINVRRCSRNDSTEAKMAVSSSKKTSLIRGRELPTAVESAIKAAHARLGTPPHTGPIIKKWEICGYIIKDQILAPKVATAVAAQISRSGTPADPAVLTIGDDILCGFVERPNIPTERIL